MTAKINDIDLEIKYSIDSDYRGTWTNIHKVNVTGSDEDISELLSDYWMERIEEKASANYRGLED